MLRSMGMPCTTSGPCRPLVCRRVTIPLAFAGFGVISRPGSARQGVQRARGQHHAATAARTLGRRASRLSVPLGRRCGTAVAATAGSLTLEEALTDAAPATFEPQMDPGAGVAVLAIFFVVALLQIRQTAAAKAREERDVALKKLQELRAQRLEASLPEDDVRRIEQQIQELEKQEDDARTLVTIFGLQIRLITPRPVGTALDKLDSTQPANKTPGSTTSDQAPAQEEMGIGMSGFVLNFLTLALIPYLFMVGYQMAFIDPVMDAAGEYTGVTVMMP